MIVVLALALVLLVVALGFATSAALDVRRARRQQERREEPATLESGGSHLSTWRTTD